MMGADAPIPPIAMQPPPRRTPRGGLNYLSFLLIWQSIVIAIGVPQRRGFSPESVCAQNGFFCMKTFAGVFSHKKNPGKNPERFPVPIVTDPRIEPRSFPPSPPAQVLPTFATQTRVLAFFKASGVRKTRPGVLRAGFRAYCTVFDRIRSVFGSPKKGPG